MVERERGDEEEGKVLGTVYQYSFVYLQFDVRVSFLVCGAYIFPDLMGFKYVLNGINNEQAYSEVRYDITTQEK